MVKVRVKISDESLRDLQIMMYELMLKLVIDTLEEGNHIATGDLIRSFEVYDETIEKEDNHVELESKYRLLDPAGTILHTGSRPHCPPIEPLIEWAEAKFGLSGEEAGALAWRVRRAICERGNRAYFWLDQLREKMGEVDINVKVKHGQ